LLSLRIPKHGNHFNAKFLEKLSFNVEKETRSKPMEPKGSFQRNAQRKEGTSKRRYKKNTTPVDLTCEDETDKNTESENQGSIDLTCLYSPNWLNDEVINTYLKLLNNHNNDVFMYETQFHEAFIEGGFERVQNYYRRQDVLQEKENVLSFNEIFIPVHHGCHWFLIIFNGKELVSFDPFNYPGTDGKKKTGAS